MQKYKNKYRIQSNRLQSWDYASPWWYFVTIVTQDHKNYFGEIQNEKMVLNEIGKIAEEELLNTQKLREYVEIDEYVIMPNHVHLILIIKETDEKRGDMPGNISSDAFTTNGKNKREFSKPIAKSLSIILNQFKGSVTRKCRINNLPFKWQANFHDRIIRNEHELFNIRKYIQQNPLKWHLKKNIPDNLESE